MNTNAAKQEAEVRHRYMEQFIEQFMKSGMHKYENVNCGKLIKIIWRETVI